jgi:hypothetical protein
MFHPFSGYATRPRLQTLTHCTTPLLDAQWLCLRYADFSWRSDAYLRLEWVAAIVDGRVSAAKPWGSPSNCDVPI